MAHDSIPLKEFNHYFKNVKDLDYIDVYRIIDLYAIFDPCIQHALKKLLVAGGRGAKDMAKDIQEAIASLTRWQEMRLEDQETIDNLNQELNSDPPNIVIAHTIEYDSFEDFLASPEGEKALMAAINKNRTNDGEPQT